MTDEHQISIHAPHTGRDASAARPRYKSAEFQSTRPIRGATQPGHGVFYQYQFQSTRPIRGATILYRVLCLRHPISIHAPHTGRDYGCSAVSPACLIFQSTRPIRGATRNNTKTEQKTAISIHAPHTGRDLCSTGRKRRNNTFQSTRPIRGATAKMHNLCSAFLQ